MKNLEEQRVCVKFCFKLGKTFTETFLMLQRAYGDDCLSRTQCHGWYQRFKSGRTSTKDDPKSGRPSTSTDDYHIEKVRAVIRGNRHLTVREVSEEVGICKSSCHMILKEKLMMHLFAAKFMPHLLTDEQKRYRVKISQELINCTNVNKNFLKNLITGDESWIHSYDVETNKQSMQWMGTSSPRPKKARQTITNVKVMLIVFFDWNGIVHYEFVPRDQTINKDFYLEVLKRLINAVQMKRPEAWKNKTWMLHHDNAPAHTSIPIRELLTKHETTLVPKPPYSPDLTPADFFLFPKLKSTLKGCHFQTVEEIEECVQINLNLIPQIDFQNAFQNLKKRWEQCIDNGGDYFEGDKL